MSKNNFPVIRIGTRDSELAMWQAQTVATLIQDLGYATELVPVKSTGDIILDKPLYELGITGIFTKTLDIALLAGQIDIAVHSMKDVPTALPQGMVQAAVLKRANPHDLLIHKGNLEELEGEAIIATGSLRRQAQWLHRYPKHKTVDLRGNVNTRMQKLNDNPWTGAIFAAAGLERINLKPSTYQTLDWMIPAPAQGVMMIVGMANQPEILDVISELNDIEAEIATYIERQFLRTLEGGCTAPIGAYATYLEEEDVIQFDGALFSLDGQKKLSVSRKIEVNQWKKIGYELAHEILNNGGRELMHEIRQKLDKH